MIFKDNISIHSSKRIEIIDITLDIQSIIEKSKISNGIINIFSKHSTSAIIINENETGLLTDFEETLKAIFPKNKDYNHDLIDTNADSHLRSLFLGCNENIPITDSKLSLGTWQSVLFIEFDGPRNRTIELTIVGE